MAVSGFSVFGPVSFISAPQPQMLCCKRTTWAFPFRPRAPSLLVPRLLAPPGFLLASILHNRASAVEERDQCLIVGSSCVISGVKCGLTEAQANIFRLTLIWQFGVTSQRHVRFARFNQFCHVFHFIS